MISNDNDNNSWSLLWVRLWGQKDWRAPIRRPLRGQVFSAFCRRRPGLVTHVLNPRGSGSHDTEGTLVEVFESAVMALSLPFSWTHVLYLYHSGIGLDHLYGSYQLYSLVTPFTNRWRSLPAGGRHILADKFQSRVEERSVLRPCQDWGEVVGMEGISGENTGS